MANFSGRANGSDSDPLGSFNASEFAEKLKAAGAGEETKAKDEGKVEEEEDVVDAEKTELWGEIFFLINIQPALYILPWIWN